MRTNLFINVASFIAVIGLGLFGYLSITKSDAETNSRMIDSKDVPLEKFETLKEEYALIKKKLIEAREEKLSLDSSMLMQSTAKLTLSEDISRLSAQKVSLGSEILGLKAKVDVENVELKKLIEEKKEFEKFRARFNLFQVNEQEKIQKLAQEIDRLSLVEKTIKNDNNSLKLAKKELIVAFENEIKQKELEFETFSETTEEQLVSLKDKIKDLESEKVEILQKFREKSKLAERLASAKVSGEKAENEIALKELNDLRRLRGKFNQLNGLKVIFSGHMIYDEGKRQIVFKADNSIGIPIFQDDFTGSIAGECGLPIDEEIATRCSATIIAEFVVKESGLFLRGKEIVEVIKK